MPPDSINREYPIFTGQIQNLIWPFPNKSSVWLYGKGLQLLCKTYLQTVFKTVEKDSVLGNPTILRLNTALQKPESR